MRIDRLDHLVLTVKSIPTTCDFYSRALGMEVVTFGENRKALAFGSQKINLHEAGHEVNPKAYRPTPGSADLCFITLATVSQIMEHFNRLGIEIIEGPVKRTGALGPMESVYLRDPDGNLIEISNYPDPAL